ncbi:MAG: HAD family hydrolase [Muribaculaceae bacterium]|nr:HAD family hydrolase [Muribaculaceae bacterium]
MKEQLETTHDSIVFDMDGTLWDATDSYAKVWNESARRLGIDINITGQVLLQYMGKPIDIIFDELFKGTFPVTAEKYLSVVDIVEDELMPTLGGKLYEGVEPGIKALSNHYKLFLLSNCGINGLNNFLRYTKLSQYFSGSITFGETGKQKSGNLKKLSERYSLKNPLYVGDTQGDCDETHKAGLEFALVTYGFGDAVDSDIRFNCFDSLVEYFTKQK